jgi:hypothetical protein
MSDDVTDIIILQGFHTLLKKKRILIYKGSGAKSYMTNGLFIDD